MKDHHHHRHHHHHHHRRKRDVVSWSRFFWCTIFLVFSCVLFTSFTFSTTFRLFFGETIHPILVSPWRNPAMEAVSSSSVESPITPGITVRETVVFPDEVVIFLKYPPFSRLFSKDEIDCVYFAANSSETELRLPPLHVENDNLDDQIVRCPIGPRGLTVSMAVKSDGGGHIAPGPTTHHWDSIVYEALIDRDNTTVVFVKGLNLRPERVSDSSRFECVYGWDFTKPRLSLRSEVVSVAQEIVRCKTPLSILSSSKSQRIGGDSVKVSIRVKGRGVLQSMARPEHRLRPDPHVTKEHEMCICTMLHNQARFLREWVMYHAQIGVQRWYIYDNNSDDEIEDVVESLEGAKYNISRHLWPWIKTQEAGFAHCALRARDSCKWVGFIDVDEFFHFPSGLSLYDVLRNQSMPSNVAELRTVCHSFGPSGLKHVPPKGVMVGYTCRLRAPERHKSIVKPEALNSSLINVVHHFHLSDGYDFVNVDGGVMVINHYKYQVWEVFKEKFRRRVATYVADWQEEENVGSKDRAPGLGTRAVEPPDWSSRFCEVTDTGLKDRVLQIFQDPQAGLLPWQELPVEEENSQQKKNGGIENEILVEHKRVRKRKGSL